MAVVLCGGSGTRLWPLSTDDFPKPFIPLPDGRTLIEKTYRRALSIKGVEGVITIANQKFETLCRNEYAKIGSDIPNLCLLEPQGRDTAAAILLGSLAARHRVDAETVLLVLPADHLIENETAFVEDVERAVQSAEQGFLTTFGILTHKPETGYGYIHAGSEVFAYVHAVKEFTEKPDEPTAEKFHADPDFFWNSGMFCFRADSILGEYEKLKPELFELGLKTWNMTAAPHDNLVINLDFLTRMEKISFDFAIMEPTKLSTVVKAKFDWKDIGSWTSYADLLQMDTSKNSFRTEGKIFSREVENNILYFANPERKIALIGISDLVIIETEEGLLIADKNKIQNVKDAAQYFVKNP